MAAKVSFETIISDRNTRLSLPEEEVYHKGWIQQIRNQIPHLNIALGFAPDTKRGATLDNVHVVSVTMASNGRLVVHHGTDPAAMVPSTYNAVEIRSAVNGFQPGPTQTVLALVVFTKARTSHGHIVNSEDVRGFAYPFDVSEAQDLLRDPENADLGFVFQNDLRKTKDRTVILKEARDHNAARRERADNVIFSLAKGEKKGPGKKALVARTKAGKPIRAHAPIEGLGAVPLGVPVPCSLRESFDVIVADPMPGRPLIVDTPERTEFASEPAVEYRPQDRVIVRGAYIWSILDAFGIEEGVLEGDLEEDSKLAKLLEKARGQLDKGKIKPGLELYKYASGVLESHPDYPLKGAPARDFMDRYGLEVIRLMVECLEAAFAPEPEEPEVDETGDGDSEGDTEEEEGNSRPPMPVIPGVTDGDSESTDEETDGEPPEGTATA